MLLDKDWIAARIPHQGDMCLLDHVVSWDENNLTCHASSHTLAEHPLKKNNQLGITIGIEYAAQAMAVHSALLAQDDSRPALGFLTSVRDVCWHVARLDDIPSPLLVQIERISGNESNVLYQFQLSAAQATLLTGRASVMLNAQGVM